MRVGSGIERRRYTLQHPANIRPEDLVTFIHHPVFTQDWRDLELDDDDLCELEMCVMCGGSNARTMVGTSGVRLMSVTPEPRIDRTVIEVIVGYVFFEERAIVALLAAEPRGGDTRISNEERERLCQLVLEIAEDI